MRLHRTKCGDTGSVLKGELVGFDTIYSAARALAAVLRDGTAVIWTSQVGLSTSLVRLELDTFDILLMYRSLDE